MTKRQRDIDRELSDLMAERITLRAHLRAVEDAIEALDAERTMLMAESGARRPDDDAYSR